MFSQKTFGHITVIKAHINVYFFQGFTQPFVVSPQPKAIIVCKCMTVLTRVCVPACIRITFILFSWPVFVYSVGSWLTYGHAIACLWLSSSKQKQTAQVPSFHHSIPQYVDRMRVCGIILQSGINAITVQTVNQHPPNHLF